MKRVLRQSAAEAVVAGAAEVGTAVDEVVMGVVAVGAAAMAAVAGAAEIAATVAIAGRQTVRN